MSEPEQVPRPTSHSAKCWCRCGDTLAVNSNDGRMVRDVVDEFWLLHQGDGHGSTTASVARNARRRQAAS